MADDTQRAIAESIGVPVARRHIFLCCDQTKPKCCDKERGLAAWDFLKRRLKELGLSEQGGILRTKANCLRICEGGPIAVVYPEGAWYGAVRPAGARADHPGASHRRPRRRGRADRAASARLRRPGGWGRPPVAQAFRSVKKCLTAGTAEIAGTLRFLRSPAALKGCATSRSRRLSTNPFPKPSNGPIGERSAWTHCFRTSASGGASCGARRDSPLPPCSRWRWASGRRRRFSASSIGSFCARCPTPTRIG